MVTLQVEMEVVHGSLEDEVLDVTPDYLPASPSELLPRTGTSDEVPLPYLSSPAPTARCASRRTCVLCAVLRCSVLCCSGRRRLQQLEQRFAACCLAGAAVAQAIRGWSIPHPPWRSPHASSFLGRAPVICGNAICCVAAAAPSRSHASFAFTCPP